MGWRGRQDVKRTSVSNVSNKEKRIKRSWNSKLCGSVLPQKPYSLLGSSTAGFLEFHPLTPK